MAGEWEKRYYGFRGSCESGKGKFSPPHKMFFNPMGFQFNLICDIIFNGLDDIFTNIGSIHMAYLLSIGIDKYFAGNVILLNL